MGNMRQATGGVASAEQQMELPFATVVEKHL
jgi:hypothetical protein